MNVGPHPAVAPGGAVSTSVVVEVPIRRAAVDLQVAAESTQKAERLNVVQATTSEKFLSRSANVQYYAATLRSRSEMQIPKLLRVLLRQPVQNAGGEVAPRPIW